MTDIRIGQGYDVHAFGDGDHVVMGGVRIPHERGVLAHSDGDVVIHALCDALLGRFFGGATTWSVTLIAAVAAAGLAWVAAFGWASRRIERQADAFAAAHLAQEKRQPVIDADSAGTMIHALQRVADLNHIRVAQRSWRHGSIESRQSQLRTGALRGLQHRGPGRAPAATAVVSGAVD